MKKGPTLVVKDRTKAINEAIKSLKTSKVLIGIPEDGDERDQSDEGIGNAALLFINNFGSPANNIPPRPVMEIGIRNAQEEIAAEMEKAAKKTLDGKGGLGVMMQYFTRVGIIGSTSVKKAIDDQIDIEPPADSTLAGRESAGFKGTKALLVTGQMRNAITYVVKGGR